MKTKHCKVNESNQNNTRCYGNLAVTLNGFFRVWPHGDRRLYRLGIKVDYGGMDERYAMNKTIASRLNGPCSVIAALR